tara:strand:+ start:871 stop:2091 length:1221 start_codon:yes stop_codon:yes gene_type:complete
MKTNLKKIFLILFCFILSNSSNSQGLFFSIEEEMEFVDPLDFNYSGFIELNFPYKKSLRKYAPTPRNQDGGTCVGWAISYSAISIMFNSITNTTNQDIKDITSFDPYFIYSILKTVDNYNLCNQGLNIERALKNIINYGAKNWHITNPPGHIENDVNDWCDDRYNLSELNNWSKTYTKPYKPKNFYYLMDEGEENYINQVKYLINQKRPIIFGIDLRESFYNLTKDGYWNPNLYEGRYGGHAMTIIGYDDYKFGGSFEIMNSWGTDFGENGFLWIPYNKFYSLIEERNLSYNKTNSFVLEYSDNLYSSDNIRYLAKNSVIIKYNDGTTYLGSYINNTEADYNYNSSSILSGYGQWRYDNNNIYIGQFENNDFHGNGYYFNSNTREFCEVDFRKGNLVYSNCNLKNE